MRSEHRLSHSTLAVQKWNAPTGTLYKMLVLGLSPDNLTQNPGTEDLSTGGLYLEAFQVTLATAGHTGFRNTCGRQTSPRELSLFNRCTLLCLLALCILNKVMDRKQRRGVRVQNSGPAP